MWWGAAKQKQSKLPRSKLRGIKNQNLAALLDDTLYTDV
jgi:hypothetical protein